MSYIFNKACQVYKPYQLIAFLVTAVHVAIILCGLFSLNARSEHGAQIMMMATLIDHSSSNSSTEISRKASSKGSSKTPSTNLVSKTSFSSMSENTTSKESADSDEQARLDETGSAPVTMPNPFAKGLDNPKPPYPMMSRRLNEEGKVVLNVCVSLTGMVERLKLEKTSGYQRLDDIALETVKKWKFIPAKDQDRDINACYLLPVQFILRKERTKLNG